MTAPAQFNHNRPRQEERGLALATDAFARAVRDGIDNEFITWAEQFGSSIARSVTTSQIRNIYGTVKKLEMNAELDLPAVLLLKPRIAYATARNRGLGELSKAITLAIDVVNQGKDETQKRDYFQRFCKGFEAILAYHRAAGGK